MNNEARIQHLLAHWRRFTEREHAAITAEDWGALAQQQRSKEKLSAAILTALRVSESEQESGAIANAGLALTASELVALEARNRDLLAAKRVTRTAQIARLTEATRNLHSVRRAYGSPQAHQWQSYS